MKELTKQQCREFLSEKDKNLFNDFDSMINSINRINTIHLDLDCWEKSICDCKNWMKAYKCNHIIALASRLKLCSFSEVAYSIPIKHKRTQGRPKATTSALSTQPNEIQPEAGVDGYPSSSEEVK